MTTGATAHRPDGSSPPPVCPRAAGRVSAHDATTGGRRAAVAVKVRSDAGANGPGSRSQPAEASALACGPTRARRSRARRGMIGAASGRSSERPGCLSCPTWCR